MSKKQILSNNGFTLVEMLAIIVILGIILITVVPIIFTTIDNSRKNSLENSAKGLAGWINSTVMINELLQEKIIPYDELPSEINKWTCIKDDGSISAEISKTDYQISSVLPTGGIDDVKVGYDTCSAIALTESQKYVVLLVANPEGKLFSINAVSGELPYQYMFATNYGVKSWSDESN